MIQTSLTRAFHFFHHRIVHALCNHFHFGAAAALPNVTSLTAAGGRVDVRMNIGVQMYRFAFLHFPAFAVRTQSPYVCLSNVCLSEGVGKFYFYLRRSTQVNGS